MQNIWKLCLKRISVSWTSNVNQIKRLAENKDPANYIYPACTKACTTCTKDPPQISVIQGQIPTGLFLHTKGGYAKGRGQAVTMNH